MRSSNLLSTEFSLFALQTHNKTYLLAGGREPVLITSPPGEGHDIRRIRTSGALRHKWVQAIAYVKEVTPQFSVMQIYSDDRAGVNTAITDYLNEKLTAEYGINVSSALIVDAQPDDTLMQKIRAKEQAKQDAEIAELNKQTALAQAETDKVKAQTEADVKMIEAQAEADANKVLSESITPELIQMKEAEARLKHGWITVQGADTVVTKGE